MTIEPIRIVFLGAPQAGKSTLMAAWYHLAKEGHQAELAESFTPNKEFQKIYEQWKNGALNPTSPGEKISALIDGQFQGKGFALELKDFSGEDLVKNFANEATGDGKELSFDQEIVSEIQSAYWIVQVCDPCKIADGSQQDQFKALFFAKRLPEVLGHDASLQHVTTYLSHGDQASESLLEAAKKELALADSKGYLVENRILVGDALFKPSGADSKGRDVDPKIQTLFNQTMATLLSGEIGSASGRQVYGGAAAIGKRLTGVLLGLVATGLIAWSIWGSTQTPSKWNRAYETFLELKKDSAEIVSFSAAQNQLKKVTDWESEAKADFSTELSEVRGEVESVKAQLEAVPAPLGTEKIDSEVKNLLAKHGESNLRSFYRDVKELARKEKADANRWETTARNMWSEIETFCSQVDSGISIRLGNCSFSGNQWWTTAFGSDDLKLEIWQAQKGDPRPFDKDTDLLSPMSTGWVNPVWDKDIEKYSCSFGAASAEDGEAATSIDLDTQLWLRVVESNGGNETLIDAVIPRVGPLGLNWFGTLHSDPEYNSQYTIRIQNDVTVPAPIVNAFLHE